MSNTTNLHELAVAAQHAPPFDFEEFERRRAARERRQRTTAWGVAASLGVLGLVALLALVTQQPEPAAIVAGAPLTGEQAARPEMPFQPALVDVDQFAVTSELEDHIALLDAEISAARVYQAPPERIAQLESTRAELNDSLLRVSYAQTLLNF